MQIFDASQIRSWDEYTIQHEPVSSIDLMERAATACFDWLMTNGFRNRKFTVFCGKGNNGGDGLAIARLLAAAAHQVTVCILEFGHKGTDDFQINLARLHETTVTLKFLSGIETIPAPDDSIVIDALLGSGLNRNLEGLTAELVRHINSLRTTVISIDIPSGLFLDKSSLRNSVIKASYTLSFQSYKLAFLMAENEDVIGTLHLLDIELHPGFLQLESSIFNTSGITQVTGIIQRRKKFSHKGTFGHAALIAGSKGMMGAAVLAARACIHSGVGKLTCHIPESGNTIMQTSVPEAMSKTEKGDDFIQDISSLKHYDALGIGPGIGQHATHANLLQKIFTEFSKPVVIDADGLNTLAKNKDLFAHVPSHSILTPHIGEFDRLFGPSADDFARLHIALENASKYNIIILIKGPFTCIALPSGQAYFNTTGNPGMATGGTGDVLTGILTGLLAQKTNPVEAAIAGVYIHGLAGDIASKKTSEPAMTASDLIQHIGDAYLHLQR